MSVPPIEVLRDLRAELKRRRPYAVTANRLEGRPRARSFERALRAEVRDALWMLTRQWQIGEFRGDDAGSPVLASLVLHRAALEGDDALPLEAQVERRPLPADPLLHLDLRLAAGRRWLRMLEAEVGRHGDAFREAFGLALPPAEDPAVRAHPDAWQTVLALAGEVVDGLELARRWRVDGPGALAALPLGTDRAAVEALAERFARWVEGLVVQPAAGEDRWVAPALEYRFGASASDGATRTALATDGHPGGRLDWFSLDVAGERPVTGGTAPDPERRTLIPTPLRFTGMPSNRWWELEDRRVDLGRVGVDTTDLGRLLTLEFALVAADDWFLVPLTVPAGALLELQELTVTNVFGERTPIQPAGTGADEDWQRWTMFTPDRDEPGAAADTRLLVLPTAPRGQEGPVLEEAVLIRDEMANLVWGVETRVPLADGTSRRGQEAADETRRFHEARAGTPVPPAPAPGEPPLRYELMTSVPEHWIPFLPVHVPGQQREVQLQRGAMPRLLAGAPPSLVRPRTALLRGPSPFFLHEEEVPRAGVRVRQAFQRCRWYDGRAVVWLSASKQTGRGEGSSGLAFDGAVPR